MFHWITGAAPTAGATPLPMLRALVFDRRTPPSAVLQLDHTLHTLTDSPVTAACLARIEPTGEGWQLHWSTAGHLPPLLISPGGRAEYLHADPGLPLGVDATQPRRDHTHPLTANPTLVFSHPIDTSLDASPNSPPTAPPHPWSTSYGPWPTTTPATATTTWPSSPCAPLPSPHCRRPPGERRRGRDRLG